MHRRLCRLVTLLTLLVCFASQAEVPKGIAQQFHARYPKVPATAFESSPVEGLVSVRTSDSQFFYAPTSGLLLFGEFFTPDGQALAGHPADAPAFRAPSSPSSVPGSPTGFRRFSSIRRP